MESFKPGVEATGLKPGDMVLTHRSGIIPRLIRLAEGRHYGPDLAHWSHCALIVEPDGTLVEAETRGVLRSPLSKYKPAQYSVVRLSGRMSPEGSARAAAYAQAQVGKAFGFLVMFSLTVWLLTGKRLQFQREDHQICSGLVAHALQEGGLDVGGDPTFTLPADLAKRFDA